VTDLDAAAEAYFNQYRNPLRSAETLIGVTQIDEHFKAGAHWALQLDEVMMRLARAAEQLDIGRLHNVKAYDCDGAAICFKHCPACEMYEALRAFKEKTK
jgi:hypothetical protein